jgi:peroxiredoxin
MGSHDQDQLAASQQAAEETWISEFLAGPQRTRLTQLPPQIDDVAPDLELPDSVGNMRRLSGFWAEGPVHLVFMRQFGCGCLADRWEQLEPAQDKMAAAGATLVAVCQADPVRAASVAERRGYTFPLLCDPELKAYETFGLLEGVPATITQDFPWKPGDTATAEKWTSSRRGTERALVDHMWQLPGEFVIARGGRIALSHRAQYCEDLPLNEVLLGAITAAQA